MGSANGITISAGSPLANRFNWACPLNHASNASGEQTMTGLIKL